ncbi:archaetidylserine decarboxylase [Pantoea sp. 18069]|uniref:archaetidylserine decarboxylase n=1 Tax=Pantoea sp. 18069 TaxID=2681415 RepID=UPI00135A715C|nr:archaetidylserine decarboxylase [Pantoea sp. 18069]
MSDRLAVLPQYLLPKQALTALMGRLASARVGWLTTWVIERFIARYKVDMAEAENPDPASYETFNAFFTRSLRAGVRAQARAPWVCPVDGAVSQLGAIAGDQIFQAKGHHYSIQALVGGDPKLAAEFDSGHFATIYLSPRDYHRIHMPCDGRLREMVYVPGDLFSVNPVTARAVPGLFARNERVVCVFDSAAGPFVMVLVGATIVGSMATVWHGQVNPPRSAEIRRWQYGQDGPLLRQGEEMGRFLLGSTVVLLMPRQPLQFNVLWQAGSAVRLGEAMAERAEVS